jgi:hypothetical protein
MYIAAASAQDGSDFVAQKCNLLYRRIPFGRAGKSKGALEFQIYIRGSGGV